MSSFQYRKSHCGDKTVVRSSYLRNGNSYTGKMTSLYWISPLNVVMYQYQADSDWLERSIMTRILKDGNDTPFPPFGTVKYDSDSRFRLYDDISTSSPSHLEFKSRSSIISVSDAQSFWLRNKVWTHEISGNLSQRFVLEGYRDIPTPTHHPPTPNPYILTLGENITTNPPPPPLRYFHTHLPHWGNLWEVYQSLLY